MDNPSRQSMGEVDATACRHMLPRPPLVLLLAIYLLVSCVCISPAGGARMIAPSDDPMRFGGSPDGAFRDGPGEVHPGPLKPHIIKQMPQT